MNRRRKSQAQEIAEAEGEEDAADLISSPLGDVELQVDEVPPEPSKASLWQKRQEDEKRKWNKVASIVTLNLRGERIHLPKVELRKKYTILYRKLFDRREPAVACANCLNPEDAEDEEISDMPCDKCPYCEGESSAESCVNCPKCQDREHPLIPCVKCPNGERYYDADPTVFRLLLSFYRYRKMHLPSYICGPLLEKEMEFWGVKVTPDRLEACCMHSALESKRWKILLDKFEHTALEPPADDSLIALPDETGARHRFRPLWDMVNNPCSSVLSAVYSIVMIACSLTSAVMYTMEPPHPCSDWGYRNRQPPANCTAREYRADLHLAAAQCAFTFLFTVDLIVRALLAPNRAKFVRSAHTWNDVLSLVPLYAFLLYRMTGNMIDLESPAGWLFELLSVALFFRVFRILRHFMGIRVMAYTLMTGFSDLMVVMLLVFTATFLFGTVFFLMERSHPDNRDKVPTMFHGYYWAVITITTVGYGDITPSTVEGRILSILCSLVGLIVVAFTVPILTENFQRYYGHTCHLSMRGELGKFVLRAKSCVRRAKRKLYYARY